MKSKSLYLIAFLFVGATSIFAQDIQFKEYTDESYYFNKKYEEYWIYTTHIMWPIGGLPADKLHSLRQYILDVYAYDDVASALSAKLDDADFHSALHNAMRKKFVHEKTDMRYVPISKVPKDVKLRDANIYNGMQIAGAKNGVYSFIFSKPPYFFGDDEDLYLSWATLNYDVECNRLLALSDIIQSDKEAEINRIYRNLFKQLLIDNSYYAEDFDYDLNFEDKYRWYISNEGLVFKFDLNDFIGTFIIRGLDIVEVTLPISKYRHLFRPEALKYWANCVESSILLSSELDAANERISQIVQQHNEVINRSPYTQYLNKNERNRYLHTYFPFQIPDAYNYDQAKAFCDSLQRVANSLSQQDPMTTVTSIKDYLRATRPDDFVKAYFKENPTAKAHLESEHKEYRCHYASFTDFVIQYEQGRLQPTERNCRELKWQEYKPYYNSKKAFNTDYDKGDEHLEAHKRHYELKWAEYKQYYSSREAFDADYHQGDATLEIHKKREIKWAECADYYEARYIFDFDYDKGETVVDAHRRRIDEAWSSLQQLPEELLVKKKLIGASESKKEDILNLFSLYRQLKPSPHFQSLAADFLISRNKKMSKEFEKNGAYFSSKIAFLTAYFSGDYKHIIKSMK